MEEWFLVDEDGSRHRYFGFVHRDILGSKVEFYNAMLFRQITSSSIKEMKEFSVRNRLKEAKPADNLKLLDYFYELKRK